MPATAVLLQLLQPLCCCSDPAVKSGPCGINQSTKKAHMAKEASEPKERKGGEPKAAPKKEAPEDAMYLNFLKERA